MASLTPVFSTGRGGAGNVVHSNQLEQVIVPSESYDSNSLTPSRSYKHDKDGNIKLSSGRGGAGNITKSKDVPSPRLKPKGKSSISTSTSTSTNTNTNTNTNKNTKTQQHHDSNSNSKPIFSTGRGGAGNVVSKDGGASKDKHIAEEEELENQISPIHSKPHDYIPHQKKENGGGFMKKLKKIFS
ncbi:hypothetical protein CANARDRAFT_30707 [[Candida] arabinofermentans NRRL YB-2248]|uniref:DUF3602 domain-containing protein n=1 Tax=[Candida] arabinofermentans NRRL YB-2248 TaxID=983967 RepID=A0A1E4SSW9_9ASCO|nr:hypothetical protein CANARDRAFT_30707 [[Candida] arabinofermentans NRRL YB-2248]